MVVIERAEIRTTHSNDIILILEARWLDGIPIVYYIDRKGVRLKEESTRGPRRGAIRGFTLISQQDVWTLLINTRRGIWRRGWRGITTWLRPIRAEEGPLGDEEIGTAFGALPAEQVAKALRDMGYSVTELNWTDVIRPTVGVILG